MKISGTFVDKNKNSSPNGVEIIFEKPTTLGSKTVRFQSTKRLLFKMKLNN